MKLNSTNAAMNRWQSNAPTISGAGTFLRTGSAYIYFASGGTAVTFNQAAGGLADFEAGQSTYAKTTIGNLGGLTINNATFGTQGDAYFDALNGDGTYSNNGSGTLYVGVNGGSGTFSGVIQNGSGQNLVKQGAGVQILSGANTYAGTTAVNGGTLRAGAANTLPSTTAVTLAATSGVTLDLNGNSQSIASLAGGGTSGGNVTLGSGTLTINGSSSTTFSGGISGTGGLTLSGSGTLALPGAGNIYTGATSIGSSATLNIGGGTLGDATHLSSVSVNGTLRGAGTVWGPVAVAAGGQINLTDGMIAPLALNTSLAVGNNTTPSVLTFEANSTGTDSINVNGPLTVNGTTTINITALSNLTTGTYPLINFTSSTGNLGSFTLGTPTAGGRNLALSVNNAGTAEQLVVLGATAYWNGASGTAWNAGTSPWTSNLAGTTPTTAPNATTDVYFNANGVSSAISTSLGQAFDIGSLNFNGNATSAVQISDATFGLTLESGLNVASASGIHIRSTSTASS